VNLESNRGLEELIGAIRRELESLPHIGTPLPTKWRSTRETLEQDSRNYISIAEYEAICRQHGFERREDMMLLSGYLHDLGICLHFQDDPMLRRTIFLRPAWITDAVYRVFDDRAILDHRGRFTAKDEARIWSDDQFFAMHHELMQLVMKFQLCYETPGAGRLHLPAVSASRAALL